MKKLFSGKRWLKLSICVAILSCTAICITALSRNVRDDSQGGNTKNVFLSNRTSEPVNIPIAMAADDNYTYPTIVSITSLMANSNSNTNYDVYIMVPGKFTEENKQKLLSLQEKNGSRCKINLIDMQDHYKNAYDKGHVTTQAYYRLSLSSLLPDYNKVIWLDGDTLIFEDLTDLINIDMTNFYYKGFLDENVDGLERFGVTDDHYICSGVMLINLEKLRQDDMESKFEAFIQENNDKLEQHDQTVINMVCYKNIGVLPAKYGTYNFATVDQAKEHARILKAKNRYSEQEMQDAFEHPAILHCIWKPWWNNGCAHNQSLWLEYAAKTDYFDEIKAKYGIN